MSKAARLHNIDLFDDPSWHSEEGREDAWMAEARTKAAVAICGTWFVRTGSCRVRSYLLDRCQLDRPSILKAHPNPNKAERLAVAPGHKIGKLLPPRPKPAKWRDR